MQTNFTLAQLSDPETARSLINSNVASGVTLELKRADGSLRDVTLKDGPMYPAIDEEIKVE